MGETSGSDQQIRMRDLLMGFVASRALQVAAELGVADALARAPMPCDALARAVGADSATLERLLRMLASIGVFEQMGDGRFANTPSSEFLRSGVQGSLRGLARMYSAPAMWQAWTGLEHSVRTGAPSFNHVHGVPMFDYLAAHPDLGRRFDDAMVASSRLMNDAIADAYEWSQFSTLVDIAGGAGSTLAAILRANPRLAGVLFDLPHVAARAREHLAEQRVADRCRIETGSFFDGVPRDADGYFMKHILHDWDDDDCLRILRNCRAAMTDGAKLLVCEKLLPTGNAPSYTKWLDLVMLALTDGGRERTETEFRDLFAGADLRLVRVLPTRSDMSLLEVVK